MERWPDRMPNHPITVDCTSDADGLRGVVASTEAGGTCTSASMHIADVALPMWSMYMKGITLCTSRTQGAAQQALVLDAIARGDIDVMVTDPQIVAWDGCARCAARRCPEVDHRAAPGLTIRASKVMPADRSLDASAGRN